MWGWRGRRKAIMASTRRETEPPRAARASPLGWLGHRVARHPWYSLILWIAILLVCLLPAANVGSVINGSFNNPLPSSDESVQAQNAFSNAFPHAPSSPSSELVLLESSNIVGADGKNATLALTAALSQDGRLQNVSSVESVYSAYTAFLVGQAQLGWEYLGPALDATPSVPEMVNQTAASVWAPVATYLSNWQGIVANQTVGTPASSADWPAFHQTESEFAGNSVQTQVLSDFYGGDSGSSAGFNASIFGGCLNGQNATVCADAAAGSTLASALPTLFPSSSALFPAQVVLADLNTANWSQPRAQQSVVATVVGSEAGLAPAWVLALWGAFPSGGAPTIAAIESWARAQVQQDPIGRLPLPIPAPLYASFVNPSGTATLLVISFNVPDTYLVNGSSVTYADVTEIDHVVAQTLAFSSAYASIDAYETGAAPLDSQTSYLATSALGLLLALTVVVLLVIMLLYFRSPSAPALAFGMIGIALVASLALIFVVGKLVTQFNSEIESIILVFLMSIGTDYSVFLLARYREELVRGTPSKEAVETTVRWAGQSIATSGLAVMVVAAALTLSGISFLSQLGICLLIAVACALLVNLTVLPSLLVLVGPRIFWPNSGQRFARYAERRNRNIETNQDFIARAGRTATRRPGVVIVLILLLSAPVVAVALEVRSPTTSRTSGFPPRTPPRSGSCT